MYQALIRDANENCIGNWYNKYPTIQQPVQAQQFTFEFIGDGSDESTHLIDNLKADLERMQIRTSFRYEWRSESYVAALGNLYKIERIGIERKMKRGVALPRVRYTLYLVRCSNPLGLC